jgi:hypothetical protein
MIRDQFNMHWITCRVSFSLGLVIGEFVHNRFIISNALACSPRSVSLSLYKEADTRCIHLLPGKAADVALVPMLAWEHLAACTALWMAAINLRRTRPAFLPSVYSAIYFDSCGIGERDCSAEFPYSIWSSSVIDYQQMPRWCLQMLEVEEIFLPFHHEKNNLSNLDIFCKINVVCGSLIAYISRRLNVKIRLDLY